LGDSIDGNEYLADATLEEPEVLVPQMIDGKHEHGLIESSYCRNNCTNFSLLNAPLGIEKYFQHSALNGNPLLNALCMEFRAIKKRLIKASTEPELAFAEVNELTSGRLKG
jgi:hypothetical protein